MALKRVIEWHEALTEDHIRFLVRSGMMWHYLAFQHRFDLDETLNPPRYEHTEKYLLDHVRVLFDTEAEEHIATHDHDGGSWYLELQSGTVASY